MSNATLNSGQGGDVPSNVPLFLNGDVNFAEATNNNIYLLGSSEYSNVNDINGIFISGDPGGSDTLSFSITNRIFGAIVTADDTPLVLATLDTSGFTSDNNFTIQAKVTGYNLSSNLGASYIFFAGIRKTSGVLVSLGSPQISPIEEGAMTACDLSLAFSGDLIQILVNGYDSEVISWTCVGDFASN